MEKSTHKVEVTRIQLEKHPNADTLSVARIFSGFTCCVRSVDWQDGQLATYVPPDSVVDSNRPEFSFLKGKERIKVKKLRGIVSMGLLLPAPEWAKEGDDLAEYFNITHYEPPLPLASTRGEAESPPKGYRPVYDVDSLRRYAYVFEVGESIWISEKLHGCVNYKTLVSMVDGSRRRMSTIKEGEEILGVDGDGRIVPSTILKKYENGVTHQWLRISGQRRGAGRGSSFFAVHCTEEHKFFNPARGVFVQAKELKVGDPVSLVRSEIGLTPIQEQVLLGKLLGDGAYHDMPWTASIAYSHKQEHKEYLEWTASALGSLDSGERGFFTSGYGTQMIRSRTVGNAWVKDKFSGFFSATREKKIPYWVAEEISPIAMAFWYMDDGSLGSHQDQEDRALIAACDWSEEDCQVILEGLRKFGIMATYYQSGGYSRIRFNADEAEKLFLLIAPYIPPIMQYKLPERYRGHTGWMPTGNSEYKPKLVTQFIDSITIYDAPKSGKSRIRYDLETSTGNYFANGILVHNSSARYVFYDGRMYCGSRTEWKRKDENNLWWRALKTTPELETFCREHPDITVYGEVYGQVQDLRYGTGKNEVKFATFDLLRGNEWINAEEARKIGKDLPWVPLINQSFPFDLETILQKAEGQSLIPGANHIREGIVIKPLIERTHPEIGRVCLKVVSNGYLER